MASSSSRSSSSMKGRSEGLRVLTLLEFVDGFDSNKLFSSCFCDCDCDGVWADCGLCDSTPPEEYLSVCNFSSSIWSIWKIEIIFYVKVMWLTLGIQFKVFGLSQKVKLFFVKLLWVTLGIQFKVLEDFRPRPSLICWGYVLISNVLIYAFYLYRWKTILDLSKLFWTGTNIWTRFKMWYSVVKSCFLVRSEMVQNYLDSSKIILILGL